MSRQDFIEGLRAEGHDVRELGGNRVAFEYTIPVGRLTGKEIELGFDANDDFPANPPHGPHIRPRLLPLKSGGEHPSGQIHASPFGEEWEHWSRPYEHWSRTDRTVSSYMAHIRRLFEDR